VLSSGLGAASAFGGAGADQVALHIGQAAEYREHQAPGAGAGRADDEELRLGRREIYVRYGFGMAASKLRIPAATKGTARNMNTVAKLVAMAATYV
jgi:hypothetical protein